jgi:C4-dicarboxylate-specific signal transduction histidine kinase
MSWLGHPTVVLGCSALYMWSDNHYAFTRNVKRATLTFVVFLFLLTFLFFFFASRCVASRARTRRVRLRDRRLGARTNERRKERTVSAEGGISPTDASTGLGEQTWERTIGFGTMRVLWCYLRVGSC